MGKKDILAIEKIQEDDVQSAVFKVLEQIEASHLMKEDMKILLKPNLLIPKEPGEAVTTHPKVLEAVIEWLQQYNPQKIFVGDSSGGVKPGYTAKAMEKSGLKEVCANYDNVEALSFSSTSQKVYHVKEPLVLNEFSSTVLLDEVDLIINLPKIKTHSLCLITCSIKNMFGTVIVGNKSKMHAMFPKFDDFSAALADIYSVSKPELTVVDGFYGMEGDGPSAGDPVKMDLIIGGYDGVAIDSLVCDIIGVDPHEIVHLEKAEKKGLGIIDYKSAYRMKGVSIDSITRKFKLPSTTGMSIPVPPKLAKWASKYIFRPTISFDVEKCTLCGTCWRDCPPNALSPPENMDPSTQTPNWDKSKCINCYCCS